MYQCERCGQAFARFKTPGQCPHCGVWASVRCNACRYTDAAQVFIDNGDRCPKCGSAVHVPGGQASDDTRWAVGCLVLLILAGIVGKLLGWY